MIRLSQPEDMTALLEVAGAIGFQPSELESLREMMVDSIGCGEEGDRFWLTDEDEIDGILGVAYCEPERMTDRTWNLQLIAIRPEFQRKGRGAALLQQVEQTLRGRGGRMLLVETAGPVRNLPPILNPNRRGGRMLLVETAGVPEFDRARQFYAKCGYEKEARIRDFYAAGEDKVVFRKVLTVD
ncbi:MAG: GNAT family N-acetyltransferase [Oculatellaceae cyanobacterium Prado106]|nr:GNAT family N-acetyltransferase [Oculatellaceae cyanobacterium Prado106]